MTQLLNEPESTYVIHDAGTDWALLFPEQTGPVRPRMSGSRRPQAGTWWDHLSLQQVAAGAGTSSPGLTARTAVPFTSEPRLVWLDVLARETKRQPANADRESGRAAPRLEPKSVIGSKLREAREALGASTDEIALAAGLSRATLFAWANGTTMPRATSRRGLDRIFAVTDAAIRVLGLAGSRAWFAAGSPSRSSRVLCGAVDDVTIELETLLDGSTPQAWTGRWELDEEPTPLDRDF